MVRDVFSPSWRILRVDWLSPSLAKDHFASLFSSSDQRCFLPTPLLAEAGPLDFASTFCLQPLLLAAPGLQVGTFTGGSSLEAGLFLGALLVSVGAGVGPGREEEGAN